MRDWKNCLVPLLTFLVVAVLALIPQRLSLWRDGGLAGSVHREVLREDSNFPAKPPELPGRLWLLAQWREAADNLTIVHRELEQETEARAEAEALAQEAVRSLAELGVLPEALAQKVRSSFAGVRLYLRDQKDLSSASFLSVSSYDLDSGASLSMILDGESGKALSLQLHSLAAKKYVDEAGILGEAFMEYLGLSYERREDSQIFALLPIPESGVRYWVTIGRNQLSIEPEIDWETVTDSGLQTTYDYEG